MVVVCRQGWENKFVSDAGGAWGRGWIRHLLILQQAVSGQGEIYLRTGRSTLIEPYISLDDRLGTELQVLVVFLPLYYQRAYMIPYLVLSPI